MKKYLFIGISYLLLSSFGNNETIYYPVSIVELIANSKQFADSSISFNGFLVYDFEHKAIYLSSESAKNYIFKNAIQLETDTNTVWSSTKGRKVNKEKIRFGQPVLVVGVYKPPKSRPLYDFYSGTIVARKVQLLD